MCLVYQLIELYMFFHNFILCLFKVDPQKQSLGFISECTGYKLIWLIRPNILVQVVVHQDLYSIIFGCVYLHKVL